MKNKFRFLLAAFLFSLASHAAKVGDMAPDFKLLDGNNVEHSISQNKGKTVVLEWLNHSCPFVKKHYGTGNMQALQKEFTAKGVVWYSISTSAKGTEGYESPADSLKLKKEKGSVATSVLLDSDGKVGKLYSAQTTPHMFIINPEGKLVYNGAIDDRRTPDPDDVKKAKPLFKNALVSSLAGKPIENAANKPYGCSVKY